MNKINAFKAEISKKLHMIYTNIRREQNVPWDAKVVCLRKNPIAADNKDYYVYVMNEELCFFPMLDSAIYFAYLECDKAKLESDLYRILRSSLSSFVAYFQIPVNNIKYYNTTGERFRENRISGGGGGGADIGGAIFGGLIAGETGAIIGSRKKNEAIRSELITHDTRETELIYFSFGTTMKIALRYEDYQVLEDLLPEKSYNAVSEKKRQITPQQSYVVEKTITIPNQLRELARLKNEGVISDDEFAEKKTELLAKM